MKAIRTHELTPLNLPASTTEVDWIYNGLDCAVTHEVFEVIEKQLDNLSRPTYEFSKELQAPALEMKLRGIRVDFGQRAKVLDDYGKKLARLEYQLNRLLKEGIGVDDLNWRSPPQLQRLFYQIMGIPPVMKRGKITVDRDALEKLEAYFYARPIVNHILGMRDLAKKIGVLKTDIDPDGRMRTSYNIAGTSTGRFSSNLSDFGTGTNLQNIEEQLRRVFVADPGKKLAYIDLEQAESRAVGAIEWNLFKDGRYLDACESGDLHTSVCRLAWEGLPWTGDLASDREVAKAPFYRQHSFRHMAKVLGHGCLTEDHEVLTRAGWKSITEKPHEIMIWSLDKSYFSEVSHWEDKIYSGELQEFEGNSISALMTHDHRVPYKKDIDSRIVHEKPANAGPGKLMPLGDNFVGGEEIVPARLIAAFMADGCQQGNKMSFHLSKDRKIDRLILLAKKYGFSFARYLNSDQTTKIYIEGSLPKHPGAFMLGWTIECIQDFIDELRYWDGHQSTTAITISSTRRDDLEWYQTLARLVGIGGQISKAYKSSFGSTVYRLQQNRRKWANGSSIKHNRLSVQNIRVLCPTVETGWFYVRRKGRIYVTGNTNYNGQPYTMAKHTKLEAAIIKEFQAKYFSAFPAHKLWHAWVAQTLKEDGYLISLTGRRRWFFGRRDDAATIREAIAFDPQGSVGDILNRGMLQVWRLNLVELLLQIHDAIVIQYPEEKEDEIIPVVQRTIQVPLELAHGRTLLIPSECKTGWNWAPWSEDNPDGLVKFKGHDDRRRSSYPTTPGLDQLVL